LEAINLSVSHDAKKLYHGYGGAKELAATVLWPTLPPDSISNSWQRLRHDLLNQTAWSEWIGWYDYFVIQEPLSGRTEIEHAAFTDAEGDYPWKDKLPWDKGAEAVNKAIAVRRHQIGSTATQLTSSPAKSNYIEATLSDLAQLASPQPSINAAGLLDAGPNLPFDVPEDDGHLAELPLRQRNLVKNLLRDLPANAPRHLKDFLRSYADELKARGTQPMLGILKDSADIVAECVAAPEGEWLQPGVRKAFDRFAENHQSIVEHYPLDPEREEVYATTEIDEDRATKRTLEEPLAELAARTEEAHQAGVVTDDFKAAVDGMHEESGVIVTLPPGRAPDIKVSPEDRIAPITTKKRFIARVVGFVKGAVDQVNDLNFGRTANALQISEALRQLLEKLLPFIK
jgi:hypothetical protein